MALRRAGNPAVIAPRCRPVALRPRLSVGFASISAMQYAQTILYDTTLNLPEWVAGSVSNLRENPIRAL